MVNDRDGDGIEYNVVWPLSPVDQRRGLVISERARRVTDLDGARVGFIWDYVFNGNIMFEEIRAHLDSRYMNMSYVEYAAFGNIHGHDEVEVIEQLPEILRSTQVDSVIIGVGA